MGDFEKDLRDAFEGVEFTPSEQVWAGVEQGLRPKKKGIFFMWQTYGIAATLVFLLTMGYLFRDELLGTGANDPARQELTQKRDSPKGEEGQEKAVKTETDKAENPENDKTPDEPASEANPNNTLVEDATPGLKDLQANNENSTEKSGAQTNANDPSNTSVISATDQNIQASVLAGNNQQSSINENESVEVPLVRSEFMGPLTLGELPESMAAIKIRWDLNNLVEPMPDRAIVGTVPSFDTPTRRSSLNGTVGSSSFNPNGAIGSVAMAENLAVSDPRFADQLSAPANTDERQLGSISAGFGVGLPLGERWILKTGLRYSQYRFATTSSIYSTEDGNDLPVESRAGFDNSNVTFFGPYEVTNTLHSISVPAQFGWRFLNIGKFNSWLNMGVAADYILSYTVKGDLTFLETRQVDLSESNFINRFNLNALTGMEFTYELNPKLALSGEVYFRQYIPFSGGDGRTEATPSVLGFGLGVNYYLRKKK